ncbi:unnamed protein product [Candidula unifasciata]|uniref:TGF-beta family profile domain-containing protein n=1 Tax=Candidula unifasciata TaxID=100452 RepID=A0A8S4A4M9_9EUPU|nr:unnamed protein product [Candidula unifasciata]
MSTEVFGLNIKTWQTNISDGQPTPGPRDILDKDVQSVNETGLALGSLQRDNSTWSWPASEPSSQLQHTTIVVTHQKDKTNRKKALFVKETRNPNSNITASDRNIPSRQFEERVGTHVQSPVLPYSVSEDAVKIVKKQPQPSAQLGASGEPIKNDQLVVTSAVPVVTTEPVTSDELVTSVEPATSTQSRASAHQEIGAEFTEDNGKLPYADNEEEESNETSTCTTCSKSALMEEQVKAIRIDMFKELLAQKLRIDLNDTTMQGAVNDGTPAVNPPKLPQAILEQTIKDNVNELEKDQFYARDEEIIIAGDDLGRDCPWPGATGCYRFNLKGKVKLAVAEAQLWFYKLKDTNDVKGQLFKVIHLNRSVVHCNLMYQRLIGVDRNFVQEGWVKINITGELHKWLDTGKNSHVLAIRCSTCTAKSYTSLFGVKQGYKPLLVVKYSANNRLTRSKRSQSCDPVSECCKRDLVVNFHEIRMAEIYEPRNLSIGYCYGSCNDGHQFTYNHTTLKQRLRLSSSYSSQPTMSEQLKSCCVPLVLKDTFIMATEGTDYVRKIVPKVIVETCGCM